MEIIKVYSFQNGEFYQISVFHYYCVKKGQIHPFQENRDVWYSIFDKPYMEF